MEKQSNSTTNQILKAVIIAVLVGGSSPWWFNEFFGGTSECSKVGMSCDDNNPRTKYDKINSDCECIGVYDCKEMKRNFGESCDDGNSKTKNDRVQNDCSCKGEPEYDCERSNYSYIIRTKTSDHVNAGTDDRVEIRLYSNTNSTRWFHLNNARVNDFKVNSENVFQFDSDKKIFPLTKVELKITKVASNKSSHVDDVFIEKIKIEESNCNLKTSYKSLNKWLGDGKGQRPELMIQKIDMNWLN